LQEKNFKIDVRDILKLSDENEYMVVSKTTYNDIVYYYLIDINNNSNLKFCYEERNEEKIELVEICDQKIIQKLILLFAKNIAM